MKTVRAPIPRDHRQVSVVAGIEGALLFASRGVASAACGQSPREQLWPGKLASNDPPQDVQEPRPLLQRRWQLQHKLMQAVRGLRRGPGSPDH